MTTAWATRCASTPNGCASWSSGICCSPAATRARFLLEDWDSALSRFVKVVPREYKRALLELRAEASAAAAAAE